MPALDGLSSLLRLVGEEVVIFLRHDEVPPVMQAVLTSIQILCASTFEKGVVHVSSLTPTLGAINWRFSGRLCSLDLLALHFSLFGREAHDPQHFMDAIQSISTR